MLPGRSGIFTTAVKRGVAPHTSKQRVLAAISKLRSAFFTGYKKKNCTYYIYMIIYDSRLNRPESVSLASLVRQLFKNVRHIVNIKLPAIIQSQIPSIHFFGPSYFPLVIYSLLLLPPLLSSVLYSFFNSPPFSPHSHLFLLSYPLHSSYT